MTRKWLSSAGLVTVVTARAPEYSFRFVDPVGRPGQVNYSALTSENVPFLDIDTAFQTMGVAQHLASKPGTLAGSRPIFKARGS
jgi:hypothetical protein